MAIPYIFRSGQGIWLVISYTIFVSTGALSLPAWSSLMADHVPETERGRVFGWRNRLFGIINVSCMFAAGLVLQFFKNITGFTVIFAAAFLARLVSWRFLTRMYEPPLSVRDEDRFTIIDFFRRLRTTNFGRFVIFASAMSFSVNIAAPFFAVYMLRDLRFDYLTYTVIMMSATLTSLFMMNLWGVRADHVGNRRILRITSVFLPFIPVLWLFSHNVPYLILVQVFAGFFWAGFNLSASNFIYDAVTPQKRIRCIAYFNVINGTAIFAGAMTGGLLIRALPPLFGYRVLALLLVSGVLRLLASTLCSLVSEVRDVKKVSAMELFHSFVSRRPIFSFVSSGKE
jgi:MFS family permease